MALIAVGGFALAVVVSTRKLQKHRAAMAQKSAGAEEEVQDMLCEENMM
jgi:hypothetical protein